MLPPDAEGSYTFWLHRPYFDLGPAEGGSLLAQGPLHALEALRRDAPIPGTYSAQPEAFRQSLVRQTGLIAYACTEPADLDPAYRTPEWELLCDLSDRFEHLPTARQVLVARLWSNLGFQRLILRRVSPVTPEEIASSEDHGNLALVRAAARSMEQGFAQDDLVMVLRYAPPGRRDRFYAALRMALHHGNVTREADWVRQAREAMEEYIHSPHHDRSSFEYQLQLSQFYMGAGCLSLLEGNWRKLAQERTLGLELARGLCNRPGMEGAVGRYHCITVLEQLAREIAHQDPERAGEYLDEALGLDPCHVPALLARADLLYRQGRFREAATLYVGAAHHGPPGTAVSTYMAGQCYERLGQLELACDAYLASLRVNPAGVSPLVALARIAKRLNLSSMARWCYARGVALHSAGLLTDEEAARFVEIAAGQQVIILPRRKDPGSFRQR